MSYLRDRLPIDEPETKPQTPTLDEAGRKLMEAAQAIRDRGHGKRSYGMLGPVCAIGAMRVALHGTAYPRCDNDGTLAMRLRLASYLNLADSCQIANWNDAEERTAGQVIAALEAAALRSTP